MFLVMLVNYYIFNIFFKKLIFYKLVKLSEEKNCLWFEDIKRIFCERKNLFYYILLIGCIV